MRDIDGVGAAKAGSVNFAIFRFNPVNDAVVGEGLTINDSVTLGGSITITQAGRYALNYRYSQNVNSEVVLGLSLNATVFNADAAMSEPGMVDVGGALIVPADVNMYHKLSAIITVSAALAASGAVVRAHGTNADALVADAEIRISGDCFFRVDRIGDAP